MILRKIVVNVVMVLLVVACVSKKSDKVATYNPWTEEKANEWYNKQPWLIGTNFNPSSAINQLEFWQEDTFDPETINRELSWSADIGMNCHRVYLHNLLWNQDSIGFLNRIDQYLTIADKYRIKTMFVLLDDVWDPYPKLGKQIEPVPHVHNSGWVQAPGAEILGDTTRHNELQTYIKGVVSRYAEDERVICWDVYNEPDNTNKTKYKDVENKHIYSLALLKKVFRWIREINPSQPLTCGLWQEEQNWGSLDKQRSLERFMLSNSDIISFHAYDSDTLIVKEKIAALRKYNRPILCTEYMARGNNNTFNDLLPIFKRNNIAAINWGLVAGKSNTIYPWSSWKEVLNTEPELWFHDIFHKDGTPYIQEEVDLIRELASDLN